MDVIEAIQGVCSSARGLSRGAPCGPAKASSRSTLVRTKVASVIALMTVEDDPLRLSVVTRNLGADPRLKVVRSDADEFLRCLSGERFDFILADTWIGKYRLLQEALGLLNPAGLYVVDDMLPQPNWPEGHAETSMGTLLGGFSEQVWYRFPPKAQ